ncbi:hypothetical protein [Epilithonimonas arachidiradicis]|uniref:Uncharacterized protein n=1 Tax=Epilithonimonas arachidiradicis TaxID=1617282 RepID=A0A420D8P1_9FLAO|nr:hypothetical protein [Epilithonimonas arachidiradicis]RKE86887.1 hypothetical protein BXY58_2301 [Epilithonimonas arachidiradicis]GGG61305.1 hypothetical protein GCM10007332_23980 [Epilithonimonas arachidiradicis]
MSDIEFAYFQSLKKAVQEKYLETHSPSYDDISKWKGIDIIYFQEDLRQKAKGNISEKTFYTYFKNNAQEKIPRIDMLNILSVYAGYNSWFEYKKKNPIAVINEEAQSSLPIETTTGKIPEIVQTKQLPTVINEKPPVSIDNQAFDEINQNINFKTPKQNFLKTYLWLGISAFLFAVVLVLVFYDNLFYKKYTYAFTDADRNSSIKGELDVKIIRENESPILFKVKPNSKFVYETKSKNLKMVISSPFYRTDTVRRDLTSAPSSEDIELKPNDYAIQLYYYSKSITDFKKKTNELNKLISDNALIYQVVDSDIYGIETMDKQKYISLVTLPTTSLENLEVIDSQMKNGKIVMIKFKITDDEKEK